MPADSVLSRRIGLLLLIAGLGVAVRFAYLDRFFELDDALIYHRYVQNALDGHGLVFNPGEAFNGLTSPLYGYLLLALSWLLGLLPSGDVQLAAVVLSTIFLLATLVVLFALFRESVGALAAGAGALLLAASPFVYQTFGMETPLFLFLLGLCLWLDEPRRWPQEGRRSQLGLGVAAALLVLTRSEGVFLLLAMALRYFRLRRPLPRPRELVPPVLMVATVVAFNWWSYGAPFAQSARAKIEQGRSGLWGEWPFLRVAYHEEWFFGGSRGLVVVFVGALLLGALRLSRTSTGRTVLLFLVLLFTFYMGLEIPSYHWYYAPFYAFGCFFAAAGCVWPLVIQGAGRATRGLAWVASLALPLLFFVATERRIGSAASTAGYERIGRWLEEHAEPGETLAAAEVGTLGWYSGLPMIDILGLVSPHNSAFIGEGDVDAWLTLWEPDWVVVHQPPWSTERGVVRAVARGRFVPEGRVREPGLRLYRASGLEEGEALGERLERLRTGGFADERAELARAIVESALYRPVPIAGTELLAVGLTRDRFTRGTNPAALVIWNRESRSVVPVFRLACPAEGDASLPVTVTLDDGDSTERFTFDEPGQLTVELEPVAPQETRLVVLSSDRPCRTERRRERSLGVRVLPPEP